VRTAQFGRWRALTTFGLQRRAESAVADPPKKVTLGADFPRVGSSRMASGEAGGWKARFEERSRRRRASGGARNANGLLLVVADGDVFQHRRLRRHRRRFLNLELHVARAARQRRARARD